MQAKAQAAVIVLCLGLLPVAGALTDGSMQAADRANEERYVAGFGFTSTADFRPCEEDLNVGGACFPVHVGDEIVRSIRVDDDAGIVPGASFHFRDAALDTVGQTRTFCGSVYGIPVPDKARTLVVRMDNPVEATVACTYPLISHQATTGTITVEWITS